MDHLLLPLNPACDYPRIPYVCGDVKKCDNFVTFIDSFAEAWGVSPSSPTLGSLPWIRFAAKKHGIAPVETFLQRWIFFGLLNELLGDPTGLVENGLDLFDEEDYVDLDGSGSSFVHTRNLAKAVERLSTTVKEWSPDQKTTYGDRIYICLDLAWTSMFALFQPGYPRLEIDPSLDMSLTVIIETVSGIADSLLLLSGGRTTFPTPAGRPFMSGPGVERMIQNGWCKSEAASTAYDFAPVAAIFYTQQMSRQMLRVNHSSCSEHACKKMQINYGDDSETPQPTSHQDQDHTKYKPCHVNERCECELMGPNKAAVAKCLDDGTFPVLRIKEDDDGSIALDVVPYSRDIAYVALSHVWVDGLGNPDRTILPTCQARRIRSLIIQIHGKTFKHGKEAEERVEERELLLWCDTYCCPTEREDKLRRNLALAKLREVYTEAAYVLVLDRELEMTAYEPMGIVERAARLIASRWVKRLWTFQESALAKRLLISYADQVVDFRDLRTDLRDFGKRQPIHEYIVRHFIVGCIHVKFGQLSEGTGFSMGTNLLATLITSVSERGVSKLSDEPLCLAVALNLDVGKIARTEESKRMQVLWQLVSDTEQGISNGLLFHNFARIDAPGLRWAPSSFIQTDPRRNNDNIIIQTSSPRKCTLTPSGLRIPAPGWRIDLERPAWYDPKPTDESLKKILHVKDKDGQWYAIGMARNLDNDADLSIWELLQDRRKEWYLLLGEASSNTKSYYRGMLVCPDERTDHPHKVFCLRARVGVSKLTPAFAFRREVVARHGEIVRRSAVMMRARWWAVGEMVVSRSVGWMPGMISRRIVGLWRWGFSRVFGDVASSVEKLLQGEAVKAAQSPAEATSADKLPGAGNPYYWRLMLDAHVNGIDVIVRESYDRSCEWIID